MSARRTSSVNGGVAMRRVVVVLALLASGLAVPAFIHTPRAYAYSATPDTAAVGDTTQTINGHSMKIRMLRPDAAKPTGGWPLVVYLADLGSDRCADIDMDLDANHASWLSRQYLAEQGYVVLSVNQRGMPSAAGASQSEDWFPARGCTAADGAADGLNDSGWDLAGPISRGDVSGLVDWAKTWVPSDAYATCGNPCVNPGKIAVIGEGLNGLLAYLMPVYDTDVKAAVPIGTRHLVRNVKAISNDGAATPAWRDIDMGNDDAFFAELNAGHFGTADPAVLENYLARSRHEYLNPTYPTGILNGASVSNCTTPYNTDPDCKVINLSTGMFKQSDIGSGILVDLGGGVYHWGTIDKFNSATSARVTVAANGNYSGKTAYWPYEHWAAEAWWENRTVIDDDTTSTQADGQKVDKSAAYNSSDIPVFIVHSFLDPTSSPVADYEFFNKLRPSTGDTDLNSYLFLGQCGNAPCGMTTNMPNIRNKVRDFLNKHVDGQSVTMNGPVFYSMPPGPSSGVVAADGWETPKNANNWPPPKPLGWSDYYEYCLGDDHVIYARAMNSPCTDKPTTAEQDAVIQNYLPIKTNPVSGSQTVNTDPYFIPFRTDTNYVSGNDPGGVFNQTEFWSYDMAIPTVGRMAKMEGTIYLQTNTTRVQVYVDLFDVVGGVETQVWRGRAVQVPVARNVASGTTVTKFVFQPGGTAWTWAVGHTMRIKVASKQVKDYNHENLVGYYTIKHSDTYPSKVRIWWAA